MWFSLRLRGCRWRFRGVVWGEGMEAEVEGRRLRRWRLRLKGGG